MVSQQTIPPTQPTLPDPFISSCKSNRNLWCAAVLLGITLHSFLMNGYTIQDRHLTVATYFSSIRAALDPSLFHNSIYIQAVERTNLRIGMFYDMLPALTRVADLETIAIIVTFLGLLATVSGLYALAAALTRNHTAGLIAALLYTKALNDWTLGSPAPYLHFFHHGLPFSYPLIIWSMLLFYRKRYTGALLLAGISWDFHTMCTLFILFCYGVYGLCNLRNFSRRTIITSLAAFTLPALPYLIKSFTHLGAGSGHSSLWFEGVRLVAGYTCHPDMWPAALFLRTALFFFFALTGLCLLRNRYCRRFMLCCGAGVAILCLVGTIFADIYPVAFIIKLSLWRSTTIYLFLALPCIALVLLRLSYTGPIGLCTAICTTYVLWGFIPGMHYQLLFPLLGSTLILLVRPHKGNSATLAIVTLSAIAATLSATAFAGHKPAAAAIWIGLTILIVAVLRMLACHRTFSSRGIILASILGIIICDAVVLSMTGGPEIYYQGYLRGKPDPWAEVQRETRRLTGTDEVVIVPPFLTGFTNYSERAILGNWAEGSTLLYIDERFTREWFARMHALGWVPGTNPEKAWQNLTTQQLCAAGTQFNAGYAVTEKPKRFDLAPVFENNRYILYRLASCP